MNNFDVGIVGLGVAGAFAALKIAQDNKDIKIIGFDVGRPPQKRRRQLEGWLGCFPNSDGKLYSNNIDKVLSIADDSKLASAYLYVNEILSNVGDFKVKKDKLPSLSISKKLKKIGYNISLNDYIQIFPKEIHNLSKQIAKYLINHKNMKFEFDNEVQTISKDKDIFTVITEKGEFFCKKLIIAAGRSGWRWCNSLYKDLGIVSDDSTSNFGIRIELDSSYLKGWNSSNCTLQKNDVEIGPFSWGGTVIPEDHLDLAISSYRSNENRWKTDKVSFNLIGKRNFPNKGFEQTDRIALLTFILANDRVIKEKVSLLFNGKSKTSILPEYNWVKDAVLELAEAIPELPSKGYFHVPTILPMPAKINIKKNLESVDIDEMFVVGEAAGISGILSAAVMGGIAGNEICK